MKFGVLLLLATGIFVGCDRTNAPPTSTAAIQALQYLSDQDGVTWFEVEGNHVFIGLPKPPPADWQMILNEAAVTGSTAIAGEFHASGIDDDAAHWRAYADSNTLGTATARSGRIVK